MFRSRLLWIGLISFGLHQLFNGGLPDPASLMRRLKGEPPIVSTPVRFQDVDGKIHDLAPGPAPKLYAFWIDRCGYSQRALSLMEELRTTTPASQLEMVGVFLNPATDEQVRRLADAGGVSIPVAAAQQSPEVIQGLVENFGFTAPGRDLYLVDRSGAIHKFDVSDRDASQEILATELASFVKVASTVR